MADPTPDQQPGAPSAETKNTDPAEPMIPKSRFDEINQKLRRLESEAAQRDAEQRQRADQEAAAKGEFEKLATERAQRLAQIEPEHTALTERYTALVELVEKQAQQRIRALPEELRALKPEGDVTTLLDWLGKAEAAAAKLTSPRTPGTPTGPRGPGNETPTGIAPDVAALKRATNDYVL